MAVLDFLPDNTVIDRKILSEIRTYAENNNIPIINDDTAGFLRIITRLKRPKRILELGTAIGYSSILFAGFLDRQCEIDTVEINPDLTEKARQNFADTGLQKNINLIESDAADVLHYSDKVYDFIFMDAAKGQYIEFLEDCIRILAKDGLLAADNVLYKGMVMDNSPVARRKRTIVNNLREYIDKILNDERLISSVIPVGDGIALSLRKEF